MKAFPINNKINEYDQDPSLPEGVPWIRKGNSISHTLLQIGLTATAVSQAVWNYLQSETTISASMKDAIEITLKNAKLIPATI